MLEEKGGRLELAPVILAVTVKMRLGELPDSEVVPVGATECVTLK